MAHSTNCGSAGGGNFQSAIALNAQPGNIINTPSAADGDILVFVEDADHTDCNGRGAYLNFKPLVFDLRSNTGHKYVNMGISQVGGATSTIQWLHRVANSEVAYHATSTHGSKYMGEEVGDPTLPGTGHEEGFLGINTHANTQDQNPYAHIHIYSKLGPSLFMESAAPFGSHKDPSFWTRNPENEDVTAKAGFSVYTQRPNLIHSFEQAYAGDVPFKPDLDTTSIFQIWKRDIDNNEQPVVSVGQLNSGQNQSITAIDDYIEGTPGNFNILTKTPTLLLRSTSNTGDLAWGTSASASNAPRIRFKSKRYNMIHMSGSESEPGNESTPGSTVILSDATNQTLHIYINDSAITTSNEMMRLDANDGTADGTITLYTNFDAQHQSYFRDDANFDYGANIETDGNISMNHQNSIFSIQPTESVSNAAIKLGTAANKVPLYLQDYKGVTDQVVVNVGGKPEWADFSSGMKTTILERGDINSGNHGGNHGWTHRNVIASTRYVNTDWANLYGDWQTRTAGGNPRMSFGKWGTPDGANGPSGNIGETWAKPAGYPDGFAYCSYEFYQMGFYWGGDRVGRGLGQVASFFPQGSVPGGDLDQSYPNARMYYKTFAAGDGNSYMSLWLNYTLWFVQEDPEA